MSRPSPRCDWLAVWILWSAWCGVAGWILSALGVLDRAGYAVMILVFAVTMVALRRPLCHPPTRPHFLLRRSTYARLLPKLWLALTVLAFIGGTLYHPDNYDYLTYRFPRLLHWWWEHHWYWIDTPNDRQNTSSVGMEWLMAPLFIFSRSDRLFFLINFVSSLFLPGLIFSVFRRLGISGRIAWSWMWVLPAGFCFILQAASTGNDAFAAIYFLAAFHYAFKARSGSTLALVLSLFSIALLTGAKASNMPLVLPWLVVLWFNRRPLYAAVQPALLLGACIIAATISFLPVAVANMNFAGDYTGDPGNIRKLKVVKPLDGVIGNTLEIAAGNLSPPFWPHEINWPYTYRMTRSLRPGYLRFGLNTVPFQIEENAGVGLGVVALAVLGAIYGLRGRLDPRRRAIGWPTLAFIGSVAIAWLAYMLKMGSEAAPRLVAVYYVAGLATILLLLPVAGPLIHRLWWRALACASLIVAFVLIILNPSRPLLPERATAAILRLAHVPGSAIGQLESNYSLRATRRDGFRSLREMIPPSETVVGCLSGNDDPEVSLWLPFGSRKVVEVYPNSTDLAARHIHYIIVSGAGLKSNYHMTIDALLKKWPMVIVTRQELAFKTRRQGENWYLLRTSG